MAAVRTLTQKCRHVGDLRSNLCFRELTLTLGLPGPPAGDQSCRDPCGAWPRPGWAAAHPPGNVSVGASPRRSAAPAQRWFSGSALSVLRAPGSSPREQLVPEGAGGRPGESGLRSALGQHWAFVLPPPGTLALFLLWDQLPLAPPCPAWPLRTLGTGGWGGGSPAARAEHPPPRLGLGERTVL